MEPEMSLFSPAACRAIAATELRNAGSLRRDAAAGLLPRDPAISAIRDCLRHARAMNIAAQALGQV
jgi:hypothetical protein